MAQVEEKFRISYSLRELKLILFKLSENPELMMENLDMYQRTDKLIRKIEAGILSPAFQSAPSALSGGGRIGVLAEQVQFDKAKHLDERKKAGEQLTPAELEELVTFKANSKIDLDEEEKIIFNSLMAKKFGL